MTEQLHAVNDVYNVYTERAVDTRGIRQGRHFARDFSIEAYSSYSSGVPVT